MLTVMAHVHHQSVLLQEVLALLKPKRDASILDVTVGLGGHSEALLRTAPSSTLVGLDADAENLERACIRLASVGDRVQLIHANFSGIPECLPPSHRSFDCILADLGLSSPHLDEPERGFSWRADAPLDMRLDRSTGQTASVILGSYDVTRLKEMFRSLGEVPGARKLAQEIVRVRKEAPILTTQSLLACVQSLWGYRATSFLPQVFQALRMEVNGELTALRHFLSVAPTLLNPDGVLAVISFHSLEDRLVKQAFRALSTVTKDPLTGAECGEAEFTLLTRRPMRPGAEEVARNPRSRSAILRALCRSGVYTSDRSPAC